MAVDIDHCSCSQSRRCLPASFKLPLHPHCHGVSLEVLEDHFPPKGPPALFSMVDRSPLDFSNKREPKRVLLLSPVHQVARSLTPELTRLPRSNSKVFYKPSHGPPGRFCRPGLVVFPERIQESTLKAMDLAPSDSLGKSHYRPRFFLEEKPNLSF